MNVRNLHLPWCVRPIPKSQERSRFMKSQHEAMSRSCRTSTHSSAGATLLLTIRRLEESGTPYHLRAYPGQGYVVESMPRRAKRTDEEGEKK